MLRVVMAAVEGSFIFPPENTHARIILIGNPQIQCLLQSELSHLYSFDLIPGPVHLRQSLSEVLLGPFPFTSHMTSFQRV
jgi:hypothetical protein